MHLVPIEELKWRESGKILWDLSVGKQQVRQQFVQEAVRRNEAKKGVGFFVEETYSTADGFPAGVTMRRWLTEWSSNSTRHSS